MRRLRLWNAVWLCLVASMFCGLGQSLTIDPVPNSPTSGIQDDSGFFDRYPDTKQRISDRLRKLEADHGFCILIVVEPVLIGTSALEHAAELQQSRLPQGNGLVMVFESDSRRLGFGQDIAGDPTTGRVPIHETAAILTRVRKATDPSLPAEVYIETLTGNLVKELDGYFKRRHAPAPAGRTVRLTLLTVGGLALLALGALGVGALVRLPAMAGKQRFKFPAVDRPERLGAPCGGGNVTVRRFREK